MPPVASDPAGLTRRSLLLAFGASVVAGCAPRVIPATPDEITRLSDAFVALSPRVDRREAAHAARIAFTYPLELRAQYEVEDPPILHNMKVNAGIKPRGLCWQWAEDMQKRLEREQFETLQTHRAIANAFNPLRIDHSTVILSARGARFDEGIILDPWRFGGRLFWAPVLEDPRYDWVLRKEVFARKRALGLGRDEPSSEPLPST